MIIKHLEYEYKFAPIQIYGFGKELWVGSGWER